MTGYKNLLLKEDDIEKIAVLRINICKLCESYSKIGICKECGCLIAAKSRVKEENCKLNKW